MSMSHVAAAMLAAPIAGSIWFTFLAEPLRIEETFFDKKVYQAGEEINVTSVGKKSAWAARFCSAVESNLFLMDSTGLIVEYEQPKNFNAGNIKALRSIRTVPGHFKPGEAFGWESVTYRCFGFYDKTSISRDRGRFTVSGST